MIYALVAVVVLAFDLAVTIAVARSDLYEPGQKRLQYLLIWLVPLFGALITGIILREQSQRLVPGKRDMSGNPYLWWNTPDEHEGQPPHHGGDSGDGV